MRVPRGYRQIARYMPLVNVVLELADARAPCTSRSRQLLRLVGGKRHILALNKSDLAEKRGLVAWLKEYRDEGIDAVAISCRSGEGISTLRLKLSPTYPVEPVRLIVVGIPNVGKSSLLNVLAGRKKARTGARPGITRGPQWVKLHPMIEAIDFPGVLWPNPLGETQVHRLAAIGAIPERMYECISVSIYLIRELWVTNRRYFEEVFGPQVSSVARLYDDGAIPGSGEVPREEEFESILERIAELRGCLKKGGLPDLTRAARIIMDEYSSGRLGPSMLDELPPVEEG